MSHDEALGFAQILLILLGIPALIIEVSTEAHVRYVFYKRFHRWPIVLTVITLLVVIGLILLSGTGNPGDPVETLARYLTTVIVVGFAAFWIRMMSLNVRTMLVKDISAEMHASLRRTGTITNADLEDLVTLGEHLAGEEKEAVISAVGKLSARVQERDRYDGTELEGLIRGLQQTVENGSGDEHHRAALKIVGDRWRTLVQREFRKEHDAAVLVAAACAMGEVAVARCSEAVVLRWLSTIPNVVELPYLVGAAAVRAGQFRIAIDALSRLAVIADAEKRLPRELIALVAYFSDKGPSAGSAARAFIEHLGYFAMEVRVAAGDAAEEFKSIADYAAADAIGRFLERYPS